jgi:hypothetical protein
MGKKVTRKLASQWEGLKKKEVYQENTTTMFLKFLVLLMKTTP